MTDKPYGLDFFDKIVNVQFGSAGIIFVQVSYTFSNKLLSPPARPGVTLQMPYGNGNVLGRVDKLVAGARPVPVVNPVSAAMMTSLFQWTPAPLVDKTSTAKPEGKQSIWWVSGFGQAGTGPPLGYIIPEVTAQNFADQVFYTAGQSFPYVLTTDPDGNAAVGASVIEVQSPGFMIYVNPGDPNPFQSQLHTVAPAFVTSSNIYPSFAAAAQTASWINSLPIFPNEGNPPTGIYQMNGGGSPAGVSGPIIADKGGDPRSVRNGVAVFALNYNKVKAAWAAKSPGAPVTFAINATFTDTGSLSVSAQGYKTLRNFLLDKGNNPSFSPWSPVSSTLQHGGLVTGTIRPDLTVTF